MAAVVLPMIIQNTLTNIVSLLDNVMVGRIGTLPMSAVAIINQLFFVYYICIFGGTSGAGIYTAQFYGNGDNDGIRYSMRVKLIISVTATLAALAIFLAGGTYLAGLYIAEGTQAAARLETLGYARSYMLIMLIGLIPFSLTQCYSGTLRETGHTTIPMIASMAAMGINFIFNLLLIFGLLGFPRLGIVGAAIATIISRFAELGIVAVFSHSNAEGLPFMQGIFTHFHIPAALLRDILKKAAPLFINELLWSFGETVLLQLYSTRGIDVVAAMNINNTVAQVFNEIFLSLGAAAGILAGQELGAGKLDKAKQTAWRMTFASTLACAAVGLMLALVSSVIPSIYNTEPEIRRLASILLLVSALVMPLRGMTNVAYFTLRSGGQTLVTMAFDSCFSCVVVIPTAIFIAYFTGLNIVWFYFFCTMLELIKAVIGVIFLKRGTWLNRIVA